MTREAIVWMQAWINVKREVYAQEASQMIGMIHQREENAGHAGLSKEYETSQRFK